jgi:hypothetical protein
MRLDSESMKTFTFGVSVATMAWLLVSVVPAGTQAEPKVAWSVNLHLRSTDDIPKRLREPEESGPLALAKGKESLKVGNCAEYLNAVSNVPGAREVTDAAEQAEKRGESWKQFDPTLEAGRIDADSLTAEDKDTAYFLTIRAKGDFTGDGVEQIAVFASANGKHRSWSQAEYLILEPTSHGTLVRLTDRRVPYGVKAIQRAESH